MTSLSAVVKEILAESDSANSNDWAEALIARLWKMEPDEMNESLRKLARSFCSQVNARQRRIELEPEDEADSGNDYSFEDEEAVNEEQASLRIARLKKLRALWRANLEQVFWHPDLGRKFVKDFTANQLVEVSDYQKLKIQQSIMKNDKFDLFIASLPTGVKGDVCLRNYTDSDVDSVVSSWGETSLSLVS